MDVSDFDYELPEAFIAQEPIEPRDASKLMVIERDNGQITHSAFSKIGDYLQAGDVLVMNDTRVMPARLAAFKQETGGKVELLLLRQVDELDWVAIVGGRRVLTGTVLGFEGQAVEATIIEELHENQRLIRFSRAINDLLPDLGHVPLPPYIHQRLDDHARYQTIYNRQEGSAAAPTAGLHFTPELLLSLRDKGVLLTYVTLHIGLDTFQPVKVDRVEDHHIHSEIARLSAESAQIINEAKLAGRRVIAVGTTSARTLETAGILSAGGNLADPSTVAGICPWRPVTAFEQATNLFIYPGYSWRVVDAMITNFHLPKSTLLMMISAFYDREAMLNAYELAKRHEYRFFSFGDAMLIC